jgi:NADPH:quinone reductase
MKAWQVPSPGSAPEMVTLPRPVPGKGQALVAIKAASLNFADLLMIEGKYQETPPFPFVPGLECAGIVAALGPGTAGQPPGSRVMVYAGHGALAAFGVFDADRLLVIPDTMSFVQAAGFPIAYGTSHMALADKARLLPGEHLVVSGAAGGVGLTAVELGASLGARVTALVRGAEKADLARAAGATVVLDLGEAQHQGRALAATLKAQGGIDVFYDTVGGEVFDAGLSAMKPDGRCLAIGFASGTVPQIPANRLLVKNVTVIGFWWGAYAAVAPDRLKASLEQPLSLFEEGKLRPHAGHILPFGAFLQGLDLMRNRQAMGKVVVRLSDDP